MCFIFLELFSLKIFVGSKEYVKKENVIGGRGGVWE